MKVADELKVERPKEEEAERIEEESAALPKF